LEGQTAERKRVAADLHDNLSSMLTAVRWNLMALNKNNLNESEHKAYDDILAMTTTAHDQVRLISHNLLPEELEKEGLTTALERLVNKLNRSGAVHFDLTITHLAERLSKKTEFELYSLELTHNVIKHSEATEAEISLIQQDKCIHLIVSDNGKGLDENRQNGMGIQNVESRIKSLNGKWTISSQEGKGVVFEAEFG
jgi:signal transduction histidine kinase